MAGPLQAGDIVAFGKLAWEVYQLGFTEEHNATKQYTEFGRDVRGLSENLYTLAEVVERARASLMNNSQVPTHNAVVRWHESSLEEIIGDYKSTLRECYDLIRSNQRYYRTNAMRNIEWNVLIQPNADRLRQRILLHNSKIFHFLKPFEIDLLCRVREDIQVMHADLANRITHLHYDLHRFMGVVVPDLETELSNRQQRQIYLLDVPQEFADRFRLAALTDRPEYDSDESFKLGELSDAFILNFHRSTRSFQSGQRVADRIPSLEQYLNLLKCVWLFQRMRRDVPGAVDVSSDSHWPSYVRQLEDELSVECTRFKRELVRPEMTPSIRRDMFSVWPEKEEMPLLDLGTRDEMMEELLEAPLASSSSNIERSLRLLRRLGSDGRRYRIMLSGTETTASNKPRTRTEVIDFDLASAVINPHYAIPNSGGYDKEIVLHRDETIARLSFQSIKQVLRFQQAITGFKAWDSYSEYNVLVSFVVAGLDKPVVESACVQLWIPKAVEGSLVTNTDANDNAEGEPRRSDTLSTMPSGGSPDLARGRGNSGTFSDRPIPIRGTGTMASIHRPGRSETFMSSSWPRQTSPGPLSASPPRLTGMMGPLGRQYSPSRLGSSPPALRQSPIARKPVGGANGIQPSSPSRAGTLASTGGPLLNVPTKSSRTLSMSSNVSQAVSAGNSNSSGESHTYTVSTGSNSTGFVHRAPPKPKLVLFTQSQKDGKVAFVSIDIDDETHINAERCDCRRAGPDGSTCKITALERNRGNANLEARRYDTTKRGDMDWNLARLALNGAEAPNENSSWPGLKRVSFMFPTHKSRAAFGGTPNQCQCKNKTEGELQKCLADGHRGLLGEVQEHYRRQMNEYHKLRYEGHQQVVNGTMI